MLNVISIFPKNSTLSVARPSISIHGYTDEINPQINFNIRVSQNADPTTDPNAIVWDLARTIEYTGVPQIYEVKTTLPAARGLTPGVWYIRVQGSRIGGGGEVVGTITETFAIQYAVTISDLSPPSGTAKVYTAGGNNFGMSWNFAQGENPFDHQTAYQVLVKRVDNGATVVDTGKVASEVEAATVTIPIGYVDVELSWQVRLWNVWDADSLYSGAHTFTLSSPFQFDFTDPSPDEVLTAGNPNLTATVDGGASTSVTAIDASIWEGDTLVWTKTVTGSWEDGETVNITDSKSVLKPGRDYTYRLVGKNQIGAVSPDSVVNFTVNFTAPTAPINAPAVNTASYDSDGYVSVVWNTIALDPQFYRWGIERKDDLIDVYTQAVVEEGVWKEVGALYESAPSYEFRDYHAPSNYRVSYRYVQVAVRYATEVRSAPSDDSTVFPTTDKYWLIAGDNGSQYVSVTPIWNVTGDNFVDEQETNQFNLMNRGRYSERGTKLGVSGTLTARFRDGGGMTGRQKRLAVQKFKDENPVAMLRNPFGDYYQVTLNDMSIDYEPGTGKAEMSNASIPYVEVVQ